MLSKSQQELANILFNTKTQAKVRRRKKNPDGNFEFYHVVRDTSPFDFRVDPGEFVFKHHEATPEAPLSPMYLNLRNLPENIINKIAEVMSKIELEETPDVCTGIPNAAVPYAKKFSELSGIPYVTIFDKDDNPSHHQILAHKDAPDGFGKKLLLVDDLITKGGSKFEAIEVAEKLGYKVCGLLVLVDRGEGGKQIIEGRGYKLYAALTLQDLLDYYLEKGMVTKKQFDETVEYLNKSKGV